jgi:hypothetical protein
MPGTVWRSEKGRGCGHEEDTGMEIISQPCKLIILLFGNNPPFRAVAQLRRRISGAMSRQLIVQRILSLSLLSVFSSPRKGICGCAFQCPPVLAKLHKSVRCHKSPSRDSHGVQLWITGRRESLSFLPTEQSAPRKLFMK